VPILVCTTAVRVAACSRVLHRGSCDAWRCADGPHHSSTTTGHNALAATSAPSTGTCICTTAVRPTQSCQPPSMANTNWRTINIDALDPDSPANFDLSSLTPAVAPVSTADVQSHSQQIRQLLRGGDNEGALQGALENPPYGADEKGKVRRGMLPPTPRSKYCEYPVHSSGTLLSNVSPLRSCMATTATVTPALGYRLPGRAPAHHTSTPPRRRLTGLTIL
jgi:hypothetical protein